MWDNLVKKMFLSFFQFLMMRRRLIADRLITSGKIVFLCITAVSAISNSQAQQSEFVLQNGHSAWVNSVAISPDGKVIASGSDDKTIMLWDMESGKLIRKLEGHLEAVRLVVFYPDGKTLATISNDRTIKLWDIENKKQVQTLDSNSRGIYSAAISPDSKMVVTGGFYNIELFDMSRSCPSKREIDGHIGNVYSIVFSPDGKSLASGGNDKLVKVWDVGASKLIHMMKGHSDKVNSVIISPDGRTLISGSNDKTVKLWDVGSGRLIRTFEGHTEKINSVVISPDGRTLVSGSLDETIKIWDIGSGKLLRTLEGTMSSISSLAISPDGKILASGGKEIKLWTLKSGKLIRTFIGHTPPVLAVVLSPDGRRLASGNGDTTIKIWDMGSGELLRTLEIDSANTRSLVISPDGRLLALGGFDHTIKICEMDDGSQIHTIPGHSSTVLSVAISPDGSMLASGGEESVIKLWKIHGGNLLRTFEGHACYISALVISPDGKTLASGSLDETVKIWDLGSGKFLRTLRGRIPSISSLAISPDSKTLISGSGDGTIRLWNIADGIKIGERDGHESSINSIAVSSNRTTVFSGSGDNTIIKWEMESERRRGQLAGHSSSVNSVAVSADGKIVVSGSNDGSIRLWRVSDGMLLSSFYALDENDYLAVTPQGYYACSPGAEKYAGWRVGSTVYGLEQYSGHLKKPQNIRQVLSLQSPIAAPTDMQIGRDLPPNLIWLNRDTIADCINRTITITCRYQGQKPCNDIFFFRNNLPLTAPIPEGKNDTTFSIPIKLSDDETNIMITASDSSKLKSMPIMASITCIDGKISIGPSLVQEGRKGIETTKAVQSPDKKELGSYVNKYAIIIGVSDYKYLSATGTDDCNLKDLNYCHKDAEAFNAFLTDDKISGGGWNIKCLVNQQATSIGVDDVLSGVLTNAKPKDLIFIFFSGHGRSHPSVPEDVYLLTYDFEPKNNRSGYDYAVLRKLIIDSKAEHIITFIDACKTGIVGFKGGYEGAFDQDAFGKQIEQLPTNKVIFTAGRGSQVSWEDTTLSQGVFTYFLIKGLSGEALDIRNPEFVDLGELETYVTKNVEKFTKNRKDKQLQRPQLFEASGIPQDDFPVAIRKR